MRRLAGFNLLELMVALVMSVVIITLLSRSYAALYSAFIYTRNQLDLKQNLRFSMSLLKRDLENAGVFGSYSFHNQSAASSYDFSAAAVPRCNLNNDWCRFESATVGVKSYTSNNLSLLAKVIPPAAVVDPQSDILRVQYGGDSVSYVDPAAQPVGCRSQNNCNINRCSINSYYYLGRVYFGPSNLDRSRSVYFLAAANHGYLLSFSSSPVSPMANGWLLDLQLAGNSACVIPANPFVQVESVIAGGASYNYISHDPDWSSLQLLNFYTRYYFVATIHAVKGLYAETLQADGSLGAPSLVSARVSQLKLNYQLQVNRKTKPLNRFPLNDNRYLYCSTAALNGSSSTSVSNSNCNGKWSAISVVSISLSGQAQQAQGPGRQRVMQSESDSVSWLW